ncbi:MAG: energy transducer TonB [Muribaculaceae bacterium]
MKRIIGINSIWAVVAIVMMGLLSCEVRKPMHPPEAAPSLNDRVVYTCAEQMPVFPGGDAALMKFIANHIVYPQSAREDSVQGRVVVRFMVDTLGHVLNPEVIRSKHPALDREALRVIRLLPDYTRPGRINGHPVNMRLAIPVIFRLPE